MWFEESESRRFNGGDSVLHCQQIVGAVMEVVDFKGENFRREEVLQWADGLLASLGNGTI